MIEGFGWKINSNAKDLFSVFRLDIQRSEILLTIILGAIQKHVNNRIMYTP